MHAGGFQLALWTYTVTQPASFKSSAIHNFVWSANRADWLVSAGSVFGSRFDRQIEEKETRFMVTVYVDMKATIQKPSSNPDFDNLNKKPA